MAITPDPKTALLIDEILKQIEATYPREDILLSSTEFGLGAPTADRPIDLAFGCIPLQEMNISAGPDKEPITLSKGIARLGIALDPPSVTVHQEQLFEINASTPVSRATLGGVLGSSLLKNIYVFGAILLVPSVTTSTIGDDIYALKTASIQVRWVKGGDNGTGNILAMQRDYSLEEATQCWTSGSLTLNTEDIEVPFLTLFQFVLSIDRYDPSDSSKTRIKATAILDNRTSRGWGGFCEERMASILVPALSYAYDSAVQEKAVLDTSLESLMTVWVTLDWEPDFKTYWESMAPFDLPDRVKNYVNEKLNLGIA